MSVTPLLEDSLAGKFAKKVTDGWFMDRKDSECVLRIFQEFEHELKKEIFPKDNWRQTNIGWVNDPA